MISIFVDRSLALQPLSIYGDGHQTRDFIYVADLVTVLVKALTSQSLASGPVNVGTATQTSLLELVDQLSSLLGRPIEVTHLSPRQGDVKHSLADISLLRERFSFQQGVSFGRGLQELVTYLKGAPDNH